MFENQKHRTLKDWVLVALEKRGICLEKELKREMSANSLT
jgi:pyrimidine operon attenuation protein/uracil phosphoribosyltransferase